MTRALPLPQVLFEALISPDRRGYMGLDDILLLSYPCGESQATGGREEGVRWPWLWSMWGADLAHVLALFPQQKPRTSPAWATWRSMPARTRLSSAWPPGARPRQSTSCSRWGSLRPWPGVRRGVSGLFYPRLHPGGRVPHTLAPVTRCLPQQSPVTPGHTQRDYCVGGTG